MRVTLVTVMDEATLPLRVALDEPTNGPRTVRVAGDLCYSTVEQLPPAAELVGDLSERVVVDLREVSFMDLAGWRWLASAAPARHTAHVELDVLGGPPLLRLVAFLRRALLDAADDETAWLIGRIRSPQPGRD